MSECRVCGQRNVYYREYYDEPLCFSCFSDAERLRGKESDWWRTSG